MPDNVEKKKNATEGTMVFAKLLIDKQLVATSKKVPLKWPSFEADLMDQF
jgi:hypothetical protein